MDPRDLTDPERQRMVDEDPDFVLLQRFGYSAEKVVERYPDGAPDNVVGQALGRSAEWVVKRYKAIVEKLRSVVLAK